jgi:hypothetical protein
MSLSNYSVDELKEEIYKREFNLSTQLEELINRWQQESLHVSDNDYWIISKMVSDLSDILFKYKSTNFNLISVSEIPTVPIQETKQEQLIQESSKDD